MSWVRFVLLGGVLAGLTAGQTLLPVGELLRYSLEETPEQLTRGMGRPVQTGEASPGYFTWYYKTDVLDQHDFSHLLVFRKSDGKLASVTRNFHTPVNVDALFPAKSVKTHYWPSEKDPQWAVRVRLMGGDRLMMAMGVKKEGDTTTQVVVMRRSVLKFFLPWLDEQLTAEKR